ncbi:DUF2529 domain-containing protein [Metabacillus arenae]|uniref:DUF2529 domain-containing protein n=1 Tax=Metabacillus arenae TaxID=2771434 RepID=A0A926NEK4_9BACI|nr:DUF2529 domain-containing protein [Metabacillus arenae]MBD1379690.1 DUF2529 domain-containing protein [Metabacillus arenae]
MLKIFTTQLIGHLNRIQEKEEYSLEDGARLLAQAAVGDGDIYLYGAGELEAILIEAIKSSEPFPHAKKLIDPSEVRAEDRVLLFSHHSNDEKAIELAKQLSKNGIQIVGVSAALQSEEQGLADICDVHIDSKLKNGLIPHEDGSRYGFPAIMTSLYVYYALHLTINEILNEYE